MHVIWKDIPGYGGRYQASTDGQIRGCDRVVHVVPKNGKAAYDRIHKGRVLRPCIGSNGYYYVGLRKNQKSDNGTYLPVHHLIALTFLGERPDHAHVCHADGDKLNCRLDNLRYDSSRENHLDVYRCGGRYGKLTPEQVKTIKKRISAGDKQDDIAKDYNVSQAAVSAIKTGERFSWVE